MGQSTHHDTSRIAFLDGMRGLAILLVIGFHAYVRYAEIMPFGDRFVQFPPFQFGWLGVQLFFLISGFVIFLTLEKSKGFLDFMTRRWMRLFPAMLVCSLIVYITFRFFMPGIKEVSLRAMLPGLSFIEPRMWSKLLGSPQPILEGAFWSIYVEVRFYAFAGMFYFLLGEVAAIGGILAMFLVAAPLGLLQTMFPGASFHMIEIFRGWTSAEHFGWFAAGALYFRYFQTRSAHLFGIASVIALLAVLASCRGEIATAFAALLVAACFASAVRGGWMRPLLESRALLFVGFISYPLYLLHENIMVQLIKKLGKAVPTMPGILMPLLPIALLLLIATVVTVYAEPWAGRMIRPQYQRARKWLRIDRAEKKSAPSMVAPVAEVIAPPGGAIGL